MKTLPKTFGELFGDNGVIRPEYKDTHIEFRKNAEDHWEAYPEQGMRAVLIGIRSSHDGVMVLVLDYNVWRSRNIEIEKPHYYDRAGVACLTATQSGFYKTNHQDTIHVMEADSIADYVTVVSDEETAEHKKYTVVFMMPDNVAGANPVTRVAMERIETGELETVLKNYPTVLYVFRGWPESVRQ